MKGYRVISGTYGSAWLNDEKLPEIFGVQLKVNKDKQSFVMSGDPMKKHKTVALEGVGSLRVFHVDSASLKRAAALLRGILTEDNTIVTKVADPQAFGAERVVAYGVDFDDEVLADWETGSYGKRECPFTFEDYKPLDLIEGVTK